MNDKAGSPEGEDIDEALAETFPASDPPANTVETGIRIGGDPPLEQRVQDNPSAHRFEITIADQTAFLVYERTPHAFEFVHTEVPPDLRGQHVGDALVEAGLAAARNEHLRIIATCPFVRAYLQKHPDSV
jgi:uncharacterized protein